MTQHRPDISWSWEPSDSLHRRTPPAHDAERGADDESRWSESGWYPEGGFDDDTPDAPPVGSGRYLESRRYAEYAEYAEYADSGPVLIDCDSCAVRGPGCPDCVVTALLGEPPEGVSLNAEERRAVAVLAAAGLVPPLRLVQPLSGPTPESA